MEDGTKERLKTGVYLFGLLYVCVLVFMWGMSLNYNDAVERCLEVGEYFGYTDSYYDSYSRDCWGIGSDGIVHQLPESIPGGD